MRRALILLALLVSPAPARAQAPAGPPDWPGAAFFAAHREALMAEMDAGIAIFPAQPEIPRNDDAGYPYRQDSDFWYLTGFEEPGAVAVLRPGAPEGERFALFVRPRNPDEEVWTGHRAGVEGARERYGADLAWVVDSLDAVLARWLERERVVWLDESKDHPWAQAELRARLEAWVEADAGGARRLRGTSEMLDEQRLVKSDAEIAELQRAIDLTDAAHRAAMAAIRPGMVLTVEPGIYIREGAEGVDPRWWNIGVRIEDDVLVTGDGHRVMSTSPREMEEIEALMAGGGLPSVGT